VDTGQWEGNKNDSYLKQKEVRGMLFKSFGPRRGVRRRTPLGGAQDLERHRKDQGKNTLSSIRKFVRGGEHLPHQGNKKGGTLLQDYRLEAREFTPKLLS